MTSAWRHQIQRIFTFYAGGILVSCKDFLKISWKSKYFPRRCKGKRKGVFFSEHSVYYCGCGVCDAHAIVNALVAGSVTSCIWSRFHVNWNENSTRVLTSAGNIGKLINTVSAFCYRCLPVYAYYYKLFF